MNPLGSVIEQLRPARDLLAVVSRRSNRTIEGSQRLKRGDHFSQPREIGFPCLLQDFSRQRVIWINEGHGWCERRRLTTPAQRSGARDVMIATAAHG